MQAPPSPPLLPLLLLTLEDELVEDDEPPLEELLLVDDDPLLEELLLVDDEPLLVEEFPLDALMLAESSPASTQTVSAPPHAPAPAPARRSRTSMRTISRPARMERK